MMFSRKLIAAAVTIAAAGTFAGSAQASIIDIDEPLLQSIGYDFGKGWTGPNPTGPGELHFHHENGVIRPHLTDGAIHLNDAAGTCGRMRMRYYNDAGIQLAERFGGTVCVTNDQHRGWGVDLDPYSDDDIDHVEVAVMKINALGEFVAASGIYYVNTFADGVFIDRAGVDFGSEAWNSGSPVGPGYMEWPLTGSSVRPHLTGSLHLNNSNGACARMFLRYLTESGALLAERAGGTVCASDNGHHEWDVDLDPYESDLIGQVEVQLQTLAINGNYVTAGSQTVSIAQ
jgi:hypothetical protein